MINRATDLFLAFGNQQGNESDVFPFANDECNCTSGKTFSMEKLFPNLLTTYKKKSAVCGPTPLEACVSAAPIQGSVCHRDHTFQHTEQAHTCLLSCPKPQQWGALGLEYTAGLQPSVPSTPQSAREGSRKGGGQCRALKKPFVSRPVTLEEERWLSPGCSRKHRPSSPWSYRTHTAAPQAAATRWPLFLRQLLFSLPPSLLNKLKD